MMRKVVFWISFLSGFGCTAAYAQEDRIEIDLDGPRARLCEDNVCGPYTLPMGAPGGPVVGPPVVIPPPVPPPPLVASPDGTAIPPAARIADNQLRAWTVVGGRIFLDGVYMSPTNNVDLLLKHKGLIYQRNTVGDWYLWDQGVWKRCPDPRAVVPPPLVVVPGEPPPVLAVGGAPKTCGEARSRSAVVLCQDFDSQELGDWSLSEVKAAFPGADVYAGPTGAANYTPSGRMQIVEGAGNVAAGRALRAVYPRLKLGAETGFHFGAPIPSKHSEIYLGYWLRFEPSLPQLKGGKLPGLTGGVTDTGQSRPCCGRPMLKGLGFSTRQMFVGGRMFVPYYYWMNNSRPPEGGNVYGGPSGVYLGPPWVPGQWYFIEQHVRLNSSSDTADGLIETWINGAKVITIPNTKIRGPGSNFAIDWIHMDTYLGGNTESWYSATNAYAFFDTFVVSTSRIAP